MTSNNNIPESQGGATRKAYSRRTPAQIQADERQNALTTLGIEQEHLDILQALVSGQPVAPQTQAPEVPKARYMADVPAGTVLSYGVNNSLKITNTNEHGDVRTPIRISISKGATGNVVLNTPQDGPFLQIQGTPLQIPLRNATIWNSELGKWMQLSDFTVELWQDFTGYIVN